MVIRNFLLILGFISLCTSCKKDEPANPNAVPSGLDFSTYGVFNDLGDAMGIHGTGFYDDYQMEDWAPWVYNLFQPLDTASLLNTNKGSISYVAFFPVPCHDMQSCAVKTTTATVLKLVVINQKGDVMLRRSMSLAADISAHFVYSLQSWPNDYYRIYYSLSAAGDEHFFRAHADIEKK